MKAQAPNQDRVELLLTLDQDWHPVDFRTWRIAGRLLTSAQAKLAGQVTVDDLKAEGLWAR
jgi:hypothetical protein